MKKQILIIFSLFLSSFATAENSEIQKPQDENIVSYWDSLIGSVEEMLDSAREAIGEFQSDELLSSVEESIKSAQEAGKPLADDAQALWDQAKEKGLDFLEQGKEKAQDFLNQMPDVYQDTPESKEFDEAPFDSSEFNQQA